MRKVIDLVKDRTQVSIGIGPLIPNTDPAVLKILDVCISSKEPKEFVDN
jgi:hypothetical protein